MKVAELYERCMELVAAEPTPAVVRYLHETLVLACAEALRGSSHAFGNLFSQVDYLCRRHHVAMPDRMATQLMRIHSNGRDTLTTAEWRYDVRALARFISAVFSAAIPHELLVRLPAEAAPTDATARINLRYVRCVVSSWDERYIYATADGGPVCIEQTDPDLPSLLREGMQLNLLDCHREGTTIRAGLVVVEPDYLLDISTIAACFQDYGRHPLAHLLSRLKPRPNSQAILLGGFAGHALNDILNHASSTTGDTLRSAFRAYALQFCTCPSFSPVQFKADAARQCTHIREAVTDLFAADYAREQALLEPSFVCERLGLQGRVDLMTADLRLLVEQKSGKNWNLEQQRAGTHGWQREDHYVQLLLYYGILRYNFHRSSDQTDIRLLYSRYPAQQGLLVVNFYQQLFRDAIRLRNRIVAQEMRMAREGFATVRPLLKADTLLENEARRTFFDRYVRPEAEAVFAPLHALSAVERDYVDRMFTFLFREQLAQKVGVQEGQGGAAADLWNMPLSEKRDTGNILTDLKLMRRDQAGHLKGYNQLTFAISRKADDELPNFRRGDMVYVYAYDGEPDVRAHILYKGVIERLTDADVVVRLNNGQQNPSVFLDAAYAIEHAPSDGTASALRSIQAFAVAPKAKRDLLLGQRPPEQDTTRRLSRAYHPHYDDLLLRAFQARDYFLLQGPPGTGKTSMALRFMVEEELNSDSQSSLLLTAYTNRAVDEICGMLSSAGIDYLRLGQEASCDERFASRLLDNAMGDHLKLDAMRSQLAAMRVIVGTTSMLSSQPYLLQLKAFSLCIVDEASQILEPHVIGLLSSERIGRFILIGDHKQLPAVVQQPDDVPSLSECRKSLFERLLSIERAAERTAFVGVLRRQGRMHPAIAEFPNEKFYREERLECVPLQHQLETALPYTQPAEDDLDERLCRHRVLFLPSAPCRSLATSDKVNLSEAKIVADLLRRIYRQYGAEAFSPSQTVGVIVPYRNQIAMIRREVARLGIAALMQVSIDTVERYQGSQRDVIIYSSTIQQPYQLDFLTQCCFEEGGMTIDRKLNVAMTRARQQLLMTGNVPILQQNAIFSELICRYSR